MSCRSIYFSWTYKRNYNKNVDFCWIWTAYPLNRTLRSVNLTKKIIGPPPPPPHPLISAKNSILHLGWTYSKLVHGPIGNRLMDLLETGSWTYRKRFVDLLETGSWTYWKPILGPMGNPFVDLLKTDSWTYAETSLWTYQKPVWAWRQKV